MATQEQKGARVIHNWDLTSLAEMEERSNFLLHARLTNYRRLNSLQPTGYLSKLGEPNFFGGTSFKKRWFRLTQLTSSMSVLTYYTSSDEATLKGTILMKDVVSVRFSDGGKTKKVKIVLLVEVKSAGSKARVYVLHQDNPDQLAQWSAVLTRELQKHGSPTAESKGETNNDSKGETNHETNLAPPSKIISTVSVPFKPAKAMATIDASGRLSKIFITFAGSGYQQKPRVYLVGGGNGVMPVTHATCTAQVDSMGRILSITVVEPGGGYASSPTVKILWDNNTSSSSLPSSSIKMPIKTSSETSIQTSIQTATKSPSPDTPVSYDIAHYVPTQALMNRLPSVFAQYQNDYGLIPVSVSATALVDAGVVSNITDETLYELVGCINRFDLLIRTGDPSNYHYETKGFLNEKEFVAMVYSAWMLGMGSDGEGDKGEDEKQGETKSVHDGKEDQDTAATTITAKEETKSLDDAKKEIATAAMAAASKGEEKKKDSSDNTKTMIATYHVQNETFDKVFQKFSQGTRYIKLFKEVPVNQRDWYGGSHALPESSEQTPSVADLLQALRVDGTISAESFWLHLRDLKDGAKRMVYRAALLLAPKKHFRDDQTRISKLELAIFVNALNQSQSGDRHHISDWHSSYTRWISQLNNTKLYEAMIKISCKELERLATATITAKNDLTSDSLYTSVQQGYCNSTINHMAKCSEILHYLKTRPNFHACFLNEDLLTRHELHLLLALVELEHSNFYDLDSSFLQDSFIMKDLMTFIRKTSRVSLKALNNRIRQRNMMLWLHLLKRARTLILCVYIWY